MEKDAAFIEKKIKTLDDNKDKQFKLLIEELDRSHFEIKLITNHFTECIHAMTRISKNLKNTVKKEEIQLLNNTIDEIHFEDYIMLSDIKRGL